MVLRVEDSLVPVIASTIIPDSRTGLPVASDRRVVPPDTDQRSRHSFPSGVLRGFVERVSVATGDHRFDVLRRLTGTAQSLMESHAYGPRPDQQPITDRAMLARLCFA